MLAGGIQRDLITGWAYWGRWLLGWVVEQLDQSLRGNWLERSALFWLADPWEAQGVSKLGGEGLRGRSGAESFRQDGCCTQALIPPHWDQRR